MAYTRAFHFISFHFISEIDRERDRDKDGDSDREC
jgi:hypothetical protein